MRSFSQKTTAAVLVLCIILSAGVFSVSAASSPIVTSPTGYTSAGDVQYKTVSGYIANWGARGEICTFLSKYAQSYYGGSNTFEKLAALPGGSGQNNAYQSELYKALQSFMRSTSTHQTSYDETKNLYKYTDCLKNDTAHISSFYSGRELNGNWDSGSTWNREHTWPNSKGMNGNDENDIMMLRPTYVQENTTRGNTAYGQSSGYFDPGVSTRGDVARIALYVYVRWGNTGKMWGIPGVIENLDVLLKWMEEDPVDTWEMGRNDAVQSITGVRNVFIDYPELAWLLFGRNVPSGVTTPSHNSGYITPVQPTTPADPTVPTTPTEPVTPTVPADAVLASKVSSLVAGSKVYFYYPAGKLVMTSKVSGKALGGMETSVSGDKIVIKDGMLALTVTAESGGSFSFRTAEGKYLTSADTGNGLSLTTEKTNCSLWIPDSLGLKNIGAKYNETKDQYLENYNGAFTTYSFREDNKAQYTFEFYSLSGVPTTPVEPEPTEPRPTEPKPTEPKPTEPKPACTHSKTVLKNNFEGTCTEEGYSGDTYCKDCGVKLSSGYPLPKQEHVPLEGMSMEATCIQPGQEPDISCAICGLLLEKGAEIPATGVHNFGSWKVTKEPTATENGVRTRICPVCDHVEEEQIPATGVDPTQATPPQTTPPITEPQQTQPTPPETKPNQTPETKPQPTAPTNPDQTDGNSGNTTVIVASSAAVLAVAGGGAAWFIGMKRKKEE